MKMGSATEAQTKDKEKHMVRRLVESAGSCTHTHKYTHPHKVNAKTWRAYKNVDADDAAMSLLFLL